MRSVQSSARKAAKEIYEAQILRAATEILLKKGYLNCRVEDVAKAAGVAPATVYRYFGTKKKILHKLFDKAWGVISERAEERISGLSGCREILETLFEVILEFFEEEPELSDAVLLNSVWSVAMDTEMYMTEDVKEFKEFFRGIVERGISRGEMKEINPDAFFEFFMSAAEGYLWIQSYNRRKKKKFDYGVTSTLEDFRELLRRSFEGFFVN